MAANALLMNAIIESRFEINKWGLVYQKVDKDKIISKYELGEIWLDVMSNEII